MSHILIIGAKSDIAKATAREYAKHGYDLYLAARNANELEELANDIIVRTQRKVTTHELDAWARDRLAPYKLPLRYAFVDALPRGASGKTLKRRLRDQIAAGELATETLPRHRTTQ